MQEVIIYRNPMEAAIWNGIMTPEFGVFIMGIVIFGVVLSIYSTFIQRHISWKNDKLASNIAIAVAAVAGIAWVFAWPYWSL